MRVDPLLRLSTGSFSAEGVLANVLELDARAACDRPWTETLRVGTTEGALQAVLQRLRQRYRAILREQIAATLADPDAAASDDELRQRITAPTGRPAGAGFPRATGSAKEP